MIMVMVDYDYGMMVMDDVGVDNYGGDGGC